MKKNMQYPLKLSFRKTLRGEQIDVRDSSKMAVFHVRQKLSANIDANVYIEHEDSQKLYTISVNRSSDCVGQYCVTDQDGVNISSIKQQMKSLWKAYYQIYDGSTPIMTIRNKNQYVKLADTVFEYIPVLNWFTGCIFRPTYNVRTDGEVVMKMTKKPSFHKETFVIEKVSEIGDREQTVILLSLIMITLLGRLRWSIVIN
ncbi:hypothetical protein ACFLU3_00355 [Chloroflexota bacterium]